MRDILALIMEYSISVFIVLLLLEVLKTYLIIPPMNRETVCNG